MSISPHRRLENCKLALSLMLEHLGDSFIGVTHFAIASPVFNKILPTTWRELQDRGLIKDESTLTSRGYALTGAAWRVALESNWDQSTQENLSRLAASLKQIVKGRQSDAFANPGEIASISGLPEGWVSNAVESRLLDYRFNMKGVKWYQGARSLIVIPLNFGLPSLRF